MLERFMRTSAARREADETVRRQQSIRFVALYHKAWNTKDSDGHLLNGMQEFDSVVLSPIGGKIRKFHDGGRGHVPEADLDELEVKVDAFVANGGLAQLIRATAPPAPPTAVRCRGLRAAPRRAARAPARWSCR